MYFMVKIAEDLYDRKNTIALRFKYYSYLRQRDEVVRSIHLNIEVIQIEHTLFSVIWMNSTQYTYLRALLAGSSEAIS